MATFTYSAAGLYTVGVSGGNRTASFPRPAVSNGPRHSDHPGPAAQEIIS
jgi:hypothetical protein